MKTLEFFKLQLVDLQKEKRLLDMILTQDTLDLYTQPTRQYCWIVRKLRRIYLDSPHKLAYLWTAIIKLLAFVLFQEKNWPRFLIPLRISKDIKDVCPISDKMIHRHAKVAILLLNTKLQHKEIWYNVD